MQGRPSFSQGAQYFWNTQHKLPSNEVTGTEAFGQLIALVSTPVITARRRKARRHYVHSNGQQTLPQIWTQSLPSRRFKQVKEVIFFGGVGREAIYDYEFI